MSVKKRILIIGETGTGKSSVIKLLTGDKKIQTSEGALGCTFECNFYEHDEFLFIDTTGLGEGSAGTVPDLEAVTRLIKFITTNKDGFSLIVTKFAYFLNLRLFQHVLCEDKIPNVLLITGCDFDDPIDQWWNCNKNIFIEKYSMNFVFGICICAADDDTIQKSSQPVQQLMQEVRESSKKKLIETFDKFSLKNPIPLYVDNWYNPFLRVCRSFLNLIGITADKISEWMRTGLEQLLIQIGYPPKEAESIAMQARQFN